MATTQRRGSVQVNSVLTDNLGNVITDELGNPILAQP